MWQYILSLISPTFKRFIPQVQIPVAIVVGFLGYNLESLLSDRYTPSIRCTKEQREERLDTDKIDVDIGSLKDKKFVPKTIFEKNLSPSLVEDDKRPKKYQNVN